MEKYITTEIPRCAEYDESLAWWTARDAPAVINILEKNNPDYEFLQFVTSPGTGGHREYAIMKLRNI